MASSRIESDLVVLSPAGVPTPDELRLVFSPSDPFAVRLEVWDGVWLCDRSLLRDGLTAPAGEGLVRCFPDASLDVPLLVLQLQGTDVFAVEAAGVASFLAQVDAFVPAGSEGFDADAAFRSLLG